MMFELKAGSYNPDGLGETYEQFFGDDTPTLYEVELDYQLYRGFGSVAIGGAMGYASADGYALTVDEEQSIDETGLSFMPWRLMLIYRFDYLATRFNIPFVVYGKLGVDYYMWWITDGSGDVALNDGGASGSGGSFGWNGTVGVAFLLDWLAPRMASGFDVEWGVNNSYLFAELLYANIDGFGSGSALDLSNDGSLQIGFALEF